MAHQWQGIINEYRERLPFDDADAVVTLKEGGTPLVRAEKLAARTGASAAGYRRSAPPGLPGQRHAGKCQHARGFAGSRLAGGGIGGRSFATGTRHPR